MFVILFLFHSIKLCCLLLFECPLGLRLHFYGEKRYERKRRKNVVSMPSRAGAPFLQKFKEHYVSNCSVSMPFRAKAPFLLGSS